MDPLIVQNQLRSITGPESIDGMRFVRGLEEKAKPDGPSFGDMLAESIRQVNDVQAEADEAIQSLAIGKSSDVTGTLLALRKAEMSMKMLIEVRSRLISAYQEVMRMNV